MLKIFGKNLIAIQEHLFWGNFSANFEDVCILTMEGNNFKLKFMESPLIACDNSDLRKVNYSFPINTSG